MGETMFKNQIRIASALFFIFSIGCMHQPEFRGNNTSVNSKGQSPHSAPSYGDVRSFNRGGAVPLEMKAAQAVSRSKTKPVQIKKDISNQADPHYKSDIFYVSPYGEHLVQKWETYFTGKGRRHMDRYLDRLPRYEALMKGILKEEGVPEELIYIALIESGFNSVAHSRASAVGYWQFIRGTGKAYGLKQNWLIDERRDPILSTRAAAQYFKALYQAFGSWHLAMSSYNAGEHRVLRAVMNNMTRDFWKLHEKRKLPRETLDYVPKFIAAAKIASNPAKYGFSHVEGQEPFSYEEVKITKGISLSKFAKNTGVSTAELKRLNPSFKTDFAPIYRGGVTKIRVPVGRRKLALAAISKSYSSKKYIVSSGRSYHRVRRGDTLSGIARKYRTRVSTLKRINGLNSRSIIRPGRKIKLPGSRRVVAKSSRKRSRKRIPSGGSYKVRSGDSLWDISRKFGISVRKLKRWNGLYSSKLRVGQILKVVSGAGARKPAGKSVYYVRRGDNLTKIARKHRVTLSRLLRRNKLNASSSLIVGKKLFIPK